MTINRRSMLSLFGKAAIAGVAWQRRGITQTFAPELNAGFTPVSATEVTSTFDAKLQADMTQLGSRVYSEEGIPMILACEDLTAKTPVPSHDKALNAAFSSAYQKYIDSWNRLHPEASSADAAKLVELLANRDFNSGGKGKNL